jgi:hypothetical protein
MSPLYGDMTKAEIAKEFAKLIAPEIREMLDKKELETKKCNRQKRKRNNFAKGKSES